MESGERVTFRFGNAHSFLSTRGSEENRLLAARLLVAPGWKEKLW